MKIHSAVKLAATLAAAGLLGSVLTTSSYAQQAGPKENPGRRLDARQEVPEFGVVLDPPREDEFPRISESEAVAAARPLVAGLEGSQTTINKTFAIFTSNHVKEMAHGASERAPYGPNDGAPVFKGIPSWIVVFDGVCVPVYGGNMAGTDVTCAGNELNVVIDAETGELIEAYSVR